PPAAIICNSVSTFLAFMVFSYGQRGVQPTFRDIETPQCAGFLIQAGPQQGGWRQQVGVKAVLHCDGSNRDAGILAGCHELCLESRIEGPAPASPPSTPINSVHMSTRNGHASSYAGLQDSMCVQRMLTF